MSVDFDAPSDRLRTLAIATAKLKVREERALLEGSLIEFFKAAWPQVDAAAYQHNWHLEAIAEHLEAVAFGQIRKLCVNLPPRHSKTLLVSVTWPAWCWVQKPDERYPIIGPAGKFMCLSYGDQLALDNAILARRLIESQWFQERWGQHVQISADQDAKNKFDTTLGGTRISGSFRGTVTGRGASCRIYDDPHKMDEVESQVVREGVLKVYDTTLKSRVTDPRHTAEVLVAQRGHMNDLSAHFLADPDVVHLNLPAEFDSTRRCHTVIDWSDPREEDGDLLWPDRWGEKELAPFKRDPFEWAAQWQQMPRVRGGAIIKEDWWQVYEIPKSGRFEFVSEFTVAALDTAFTEKTTNDYSALTVWSVTTDPKTKNRRVILIDAWKKRLELHGIYVPRLPDEKEVNYIRRASPQWGLVEWVEFTCSKRRVDRLLVENSARGHDVVKEIQKLYGNATFGTHAVTVKGDKLSRTHGVVDIFTDGIVHAPATLDEHGNVAFRDWADMVIRDCAEFPWGAHDDVMDTVSMALRHLRDIGLAVRKSERQYDDEMSARHRPATAPLYPGSL